MTFKYEIKETLLKVENLSVILGGNLILRDINVEVKDIIRPDVANQGQVVGFLGRSGRGKTTLFRSLAGLNPPATGRVLVTEKQVPVEPGMVGVVSQHYLLFEHRNVMGNLLVAGGRAGLSKAQARDKAMDLLKRFGVEDRADAWPAELSGGQRQRVAIIHQILCGHTYLLMDEPFSGLDPVSKAEASELIIEISLLDERNTIIVVTHDVDEAVKVSDTLWILGWEFKEDGTPVPGAKILETHNLIERGLAWRKGIEKTPEFALFVRDLKDKFKTM